MNILLVEDNPGDVRLIEEYLAESDLPSVALVTADRVAAAIPQLQGGDIDVILLDLGLPDSQGMDTIRKINSEAPLVPIVVLTGAVDEDLGVEAVREGAQDYLMKSSVSARLLGRALRYAVERAHAKTGVAAQLVGTPRGLYSARLTLARTTGSLFEARSFVGSFAAQAGFPEDRVFDMKVTVSEACANALEHGRGEAGVDLVARLYGDRAEIDINSSSDFEVPKLEYLEGAGRHRGMGLPLMAKLSDHLAFYSRPEGGTQVTLTFYLPGRASPQGGRALLPRDLTELLQTQELLEAIFAHISEGLVICDTQGRVLHMNPEATRIAGSCVAADSSTPGARVARGETFRDFEMQTRNESGEVCVLSYAGVPVRDATGKTVLALLSISEITERKRAENALRESKEQYQALAEENERLYRRQLEIAEQLQSALLHIPSELGSLRLGHLYRSATEAARIGGDFYDVFEVKGSKVAVLIGDVSGHGIEAARVAALTKDVIHAFAHQTLQPRLVLRRTNDLLLEKSLSGFVTAFFGILDPANGVLSYAFAGHPEALLRRKSGEVQLLGGGSPPLGVHPDASWKASEIEMERQDILLLYTDGVIEARRDGDFFGEKRLQALLKRKHVSVEKLPSVILDQVLAFSGGVLRDDIAILSLLLDGDGTDRKSMKHSLAEERLLA